MSNVRYRAALRRLAEEAARHALTEEGAGRPAASAALRAVRLRALSALANAEGDPQGYRTYQERASAVLASHDLTDADARAAVARYGLSLETDR